MKQKERGFFDYFNSFMRWRENNNCTNTMFALYIGLLDTFNRRGWEEWTSVNTPLLMLLANTTDRKTACRARDALVEAGFLEYKPGKKGKPSEYRLLYQGKRFKSGADSLAPPKPKLKPKTKKEPLPAPSDEPRQDVQQQRFDEFWRQYPKKVGKKAALASWKKLKPDNKLFERILQAIERAKGSDQWRQENGRFIPNPTTWLNQGRWDDELPQTQKPAAPPSYEKTQDDLMKLLEEGYRT